MSDEKSMSDVNANIMAVVSPIADSCAIQISANISASSMPRVLILTLDISGSMGGAPIEGGKYGLIKALRGAIASFDNIVVILYNHNITIYDIDKKNIEYVINQLERVRADGYTDFIKLFAAITAKKNYYKDKYICFVDITVSIFTDGQHTTGAYHGKSLLSHFEDFEKSMHDSDIKAAGGNITVRSLGYSRQNDVDMLAKLAKSGLTEGEYKYESDPHKIAEMMKPGELFDNSHAKIIIVSPDSTRTEIPIELVNNSQNVCETSYSHTGCIFVPQGLLNDGDKMFLECDGTKQEILFCINNDISITERVSFVSHYCRVTLSAITNNIVSNNGSLPSSKKSLQDLDEFIETIWLLVQRTKNRSIRQSLLPELKVIKDQIKDICDMVCNSIKKTLSNEDKSRLLSTSYALKNKRFGSMLTERSIANAAKLIVADKQISDIVGKIDYSKFHIDEPSSCYITLSSWVELLEQGDILCMSGFMGRSETAIVDPTKINIKTIYPLTCNMALSVFQETLIAKLGNNDQVHAEQIHGGFSFTFNKRNQSGVLTALSNQTINFVTPRYICEEHWSIAKLLAPRIFGWMATLDWAGYEFKQMKTIPFSIVKYMIEELRKGVSESNIQMFFDASRVAWQIIQDYNMKSIAGDLNKWIQSPLYRKGRDISDISIFLVKLLFQPEKRALDNSFWLSVVEEIHRRSLLKHSRELGTSAYNINNITALHNIEPFISKPDNNNQLEISDRLIELLGVDNDAGVNTKKSEKTEETKAKSEIKFDSRTFELTDDMMTPVIDSLNECKNHIDFMFIIKTLYEWMQPIDMSSLYENLDGNYGIITPYIIGAFSGLRFTKGDINSLGCCNRNLYAMFIQNNNSIQHDKRRDSVENNTYVDPFGDSYNEIVQRMVESYIRDKQASLTSNIQRNINSQYAEIFSRTDDIVTAASLIFDVCSNMGCPAFKAFYIELQRGDPNTPLFIDKLSLLIEGEYNGVRLYKDKHNMHFKWSPSYANLTLFINSYKKIIISQQRDYTMIMDDWLDICRWKQSQDNGTMILRDRELPKKTRRTYRTYKEARGRT